MKEFSAWVWPLNYFYDCFLLFLLFFIIFIVYCFYCVCTTYILYSSWSDQKLLNWHAQQRYLLCNLLFQNISNLSIICGLDSHSCVLVTNCVAWEEFSCFYRLFSGEPRMEHESLDKFLMYQKEHDSGIAIGA